MHSSVDMPGHRAKPLGRWTSPHQIIVITNSHVYTIKHLVTKVQEVHAVRMKFYCDTSLKVTKELKEHVAQQGIMLDVKAFKGHKKSKKKMNEWTMLVQWAGL